MWSLLPLLLYIAATDRVASQGDRLILKGGNNNNPCEGYIQILHDNQWGIAGDNNWNRKNEDVVCKSIGCGEPVEGQPYIMKHNIPNLPEKVWINEVSCSGTEPQLWNCPDFRGWGVSDYNQDKLRWIQCSDKIEMSLDGFKCAGAVQFNTKGEKLYYVCSDNFGQLQADIVCKNLKCGTAKPVEPDLGKITSPEGFKPRGNNKRISCTPGKDKIEEHLWQCVKHADLQPECSKPAFVTCSDHPILRLEGGDNVCSGNLVEVDGLNITNISPDMMCKQLRCGNMVTHNISDPLPTLNCSEKINVTLSSECYGEVYVHSSMGPQPRPVCGNGWDKIDKNNGNVVCKELGCGKAIYVSTTSGTSGNKNNGILDYVECDGTEKKLWHCKAKFNDTVRCSTNAHVTCEKSLEVRLSDGPGKCAGRVEIKHKGQWKMFPHSDGWTSTGETSNSVCRELGCGDADSTMTKPSKLSPDIQYFDKIVKCEIPQKLSQCFKNDEVQIPVRNKKPVEITCKDHKVLFMRNGTSCSGQVGVEHDKKDYWLSGSNETWNHTADVVCRQLHCGKAIGHRLLPFPSGDPGMENVPSQSYNCLSTEASVFDCPNTAPSNQSIAFVECSGNITAKLTDTCWGTVKVCINEDCGGVCADTWTDADSEMLCKDLGCGQAFSDIKQTVEQNRPENRRVSILAMIRTKQTTKLTESIIVKKGKATVCENTPAFVVCSGSIKADFKDSRDHCSGNLKILYRGERHPVCENTLKTPNIRNTICRELECGETGEALAFFGPPESKGVSELTCDDPNSRTLAKCTNAKLQNCPLGGLKCSDWTKVKLINPKENGRACEGDVYVYSKEGPKMVSSHGFTEKAGEKLCYNLGGYKNHTAAKNMSGQMWEKSFCSNATDPKTIWDCEPEKRPSGNEGLYLQCKKHPNVTLGITSRKCYGEVKIDGINVCSNHWNEKHSQIVCQELRCSNQIGYDDKRPGLDGYHVRCDGMESHLGKCETVKGKCGGKTVSVYCRDGVEFKTTETCGGILEVRYQDKWERVCPIPSLTKDFKEQLCTEMNCPGFKSDTQPNVKNPGENLEISLEFTGVQKLIRDCFLKKSCKNSKPAEIYCEGYQIPDVTTMVAPTTIITTMMATTIAVRVGLITGVSLGAVGMIMIMLLLLCLFLRRRVFKSRTSSQYESGDYEDVDINHEMKALNRLGSRSEAAAVKQNDAGSNSSLSYDDIDEQEVTSGAAGPSSHNPQHDYINTQHTLTYEVEDPLEAYDDVDIVPDIRVTPAEVHAVPRPGEHLDQLMGDEEQDKDYLEPDKEG